MRRSFRFLAALACALPLACSDTSSAPMATAPAPRLSANPASNGSVILRFNDWTSFWWVGWYDPGLDVIGALSGWDMVAACAGQDPALTPSDWKVVQIGRFEDVYNSVAHMPGTYIFIYAGGWDTWSDCKPPIMRGVGKVMFTENDRTGSSGHADAGGFMASGQVADGSGEAYRYSGHVRWVMLPDGSGREETSINLQPLQ